MASDGFLGRWSRRKLSEDKVPDKAAEVQVNANASASANANANASANASANANANANANGAQMDPFALRYRRAPEASMPAEDASSTEVSKTQTQAPLPTLQDIPALTPESDFKPYLNQGVEPHVRNAAMKKLFADPRFNVMDRLDTYIDDYSKPDPIPESMLRKMVSAQFLGLFDEKEKPQTTPPLGDDADTLAPQSVAESTPVQQGQALTDPPPIQQPGQAPEQTPEQPLAEPVPSDPRFHATDANQAAHAHTDLRLQPDDAAAAQGAGRGAG